MAYAIKYGALLEAIVNEADAIAMRYFRSAEMRVERKYDGSAVTQGDKAVEEMARAKVAASGLENGRTEMATADKIQRRSGEISLVHPWALRRNAKTCKHDEDQQDTKEYPVEFSGLTIMARSRLQANRPAGVLWFHITTFS